MTDSPTHKNILAVKQHSEETRAMFRSLEIKLASIDTLMGRIAALELQVNRLQVKLYSGGATS